MELISGVTTEPSLVIDIHEKATQPVLYQSLIGEPLMKLQSSSETTSSVVSCKVLPVDDVELRYADAIKVGGSATGSAGIVSDVVPLVPTNPGAFQSWW